MRIQAFTAVIGRLRSRESIIARQPLAQLRGRTPDAQSNVARPQANSRASALAASKCRSIRSVPAVAVSKAAHKGKNALLQSVEGAPRRRAAPGGQSIGWLLRFGYAQAPSHKNRPGMQAIEGFRGKVRSVRLAQQRPNPSIEGTSTIRLRLLAAAPHVKR